MLPEYTVNKKRGKTVDRFGCRSQYRKSKYRTDKIPKKIFINFSLKRFKWVQNWSKLHKNIQIKKICDFPLTKVWKKVILDNFSKKDFSVFCHSAFWLSVFWPRPKIIKRKPGRVLVNPEKVPLLTWTLSQSLASIIISFQWKLFIDFGFPEGSLNKNFTADFSSIFKPAWGTQWVRAVI